MRALMMSFMLIGVIGCNGGSDTAIPLIADGTYLYESCLPGTVSGSQGFMKVILGTQITDRHLEYASLDCTGSPTITDEVGTYSVLSFSAEVYSIRISRPSGDVDMEVAMNDLGLEFDGFLYLEQ